MSDLSFFLVIFFVLGVVGWFIYKVYVWPLYISPLRKIPGPSFENPFYGNFKTIIVEEAGEPQLRWVKKYGNVVKFHGLLNEPTVMIADTKIIQEMTSTRTYDFIKAQNFDATAVTGNGLVFAEGENHKRQRKMMTPAFTHNNIKEMIPLFTRITSTLRRLIEDKLNKGESKINLSPYLSKSTLDVIGLAGFNHEFNSLTYPNELAKAYEFIMNPSRFAIALLASYIPLIMKVPIDHNIKFDEARKVIKRESKKLIEEKYNDDMNNKLNGKDLLSLLIKINKTLPIEERMTEDELQYQIMTFLIAGHITTSISIGWALHLLAQHPHDQDKLREELVKAFPDKSKFNPTFDEINSLEYLNCVIKETLRLNAPVITTRRVNTKDEVFGGYFIPKNTTIHIAISAIHRLPSIWGPTADEFDPKRWLDPSLTKNVSNLNYLPFFTGTRSCIGNKLALNEMKVFLCMLIRNFVFQPVEGFNIRKRYTPVNSPDPHFELMVSKVEA